MMTDIIEKLKAESYRKNDKIVIPFESIKIISEENKTPVKLIEIELLENGLIPERYERNIGTYGISGQLILLKSKILIVGCGGLGGGT